MAITLLGRDTAADGTWQIDYDTVGLTVGHTVTQGTATGLVLTIIRVATFRGIWDAATTYAQGDDVTGLDGKNYISLVNGNLNHDPSNDTARWKSTTKEVSADFGMGRVVDITNVPNSEVPLHIKGDTYPYLFSGTWIH